MISKQITVTMTADNRGYIDRQCPSKNCRYVFKIKLNDWKTKVSDDEVHCPMCGHVAGSTKWLTEEQESAAYKNAIGVLREQVLDMLGSSLKKAARSSHGAITYKPGRRTHFHSTPIKQREEWENEITCEKCGTQYSVIGSAYFCPCCGFNSVGTAFVNSLNCIEKKLSALPEIRKALEVSYGKDDAESICSSELENSVGEIVSAFQNFVCARYNKLTGESAKPNDFQIVDKGSRLFGDKLGHPYLDFITADECGFINLMFQRRHIVEHSNGFVDQRYIDKSGDTAYTIGQRVVIRSKDVFRFLQIVRKLSAGLMSIK